MKKMKFMPLMAAFVCAGSLSAYADIQGSAKTTDNFGGGVTVNCSASSQVCIQTRVTMVLGKPMTEYQPMDRSGPNDPWYWTIKSQRAATPEVIEKYAQGDGLELVEANTDPE